MCVTDIVQEVNPYEDGWEKPYLPDLEEAIGKYNNQRHRFLYYPWGLFCTAGARRNLFSGLIAVGKNDYLYSDTDSMKILNNEKHMDYFKWYNEQILQRLEYALKYRKIPLEYLYPKTIKGEVKPLGVWDFEGYMTRFRTLGAKRYMVVKDKKLEITISGVNKKIAVPYLKKKYKTHTAIFKAFDHGMIIPAGYTGKMTHTYIDEPREGFVTDYKGKTIPYREDTSIHLEESEYNLSMGAFNTYLLNKMKGI